MTRFTKLAAVTAAMTFLLVVVGVVVRSTGSGLGCPEWPTCQGTWVPPFDDIHAIIEWSHRTTAAVVGLLAAALAISAVVAYRRRSSIVWPSLAILALVVFQAILGKVTVESELAGDIVTAHLATAMSLLALVIYVAVRSGLPDRVLLKGGWRGPTRWLTIAAAAVFVLLLLGSHVTATDTALVFPDWPLMNGTLFPALTAVTTPHVIHRWAAVVVGVILAAATLAALRDRESSPDIARLAIGASALYLVQVVVGGLQVFTGLAPWSQILHLSLGAAIWSLLVAAVVLSHYRGRLAAQPGSRSSEAIVGGVDTSAGDTTRAGEATPAGRSTAQVLRAYLALTKPRIIELLLVTTLPTMVLAQRGIPSVWLMAAVVLGGTMAAGGANAINQYIDRDIDDVMRRTRHRPLPTHAVQPGAALAFGIGLSIVSFAWLTLTVNLLSALLSASAIAFYVFVYTLWLKRSTPQNIVIGGAAGSVPVLVAWASVTGTVGVPALVLAAIVFYWTPPHFWALALRYKADYATARVPMMPVVRGEAETARQITLYSLLLVAVSLLLFPAGQMGLIYLVTAVVLGVAFVWYAVRIQRHAADGRAAIELFRYSITYLTLLFVAIAADSLLRLTVG
ncbi:MAG: heme o synthase [Chloroflexota bacterium]|nr:heme o synthase [Chloroflexota bacterium]